MKTISKNIKKIKNLNSSIDLCGEEHILTMMVYNSHTKVLYVSLQYH